MPRKPRLGAEPRRALEMLADAPRGCPAALLLTLGFKTKMVASLVHAKLATAHRETMRAHGYAIEVIRITITDAGRRALEGPPESE